MDRAGWSSWLLGGGKPHNGNRFQILSLLSEIKESLPSAVAKQLRNISIMNIFTSDHIPDEISCETFAQGLRLVPNRESEISHCVGEFCKTKADKDREGWDLSIYVVTRNRIANRGVLVKFLHFITLSLMALT